MTTNSGEFRNPAEVHEFSGMLSVLRIYAYLFCGAV